MSRSGISRRMAIDPASPCSEGTTPAATNVQRKISSSVLERESYCGLTQETPSLFGDDQSTVRMGKRELNAPSFETKVQSYRQSLSVRQTRSLITAGLVKGITPLLVRQTCGLAIRDFASLQLVGGSAVDRKADCSFSKGGDA